MTEILTALRENRRGKGLYVEPTDRQVMQIWRQTNLFQRAMVPPLAFAQSKSIQSIIRPKIQYAVRIFSGSEIT